MSKVARHIDSIAADIRKYHERVTDSARKTLEDAKLAGDALNEAKEQVGHGEWGTWLERNVPGLATRTAQSYMRIASGWDEIEGKSADSAHLTIDGATKLLSKPKPKAETPKQRPDPQPQVTPSTGDTSATAGSDDNPPDPEPSQPDNGSQGEAEGEERDYESEAHERAVQVLDELSSLVDRLGIRDEVEDHLQAIHEVLTEG